ncbi:hypothetical protein N2152v2_004727 [Parachlorella kessleri]
MANVVPSLSHSLLFSLEVDEGTHHRRQHSQAELAESLSLLQENLAFFLRSQSIYQSKLLRDVLAYKERILEEEEGFDVVTLAAHLSNVGYRVHIRTALGGGQGTDCFHNLRHEFLVVQGDGEQRSVDFIVEPSFKAQFQISHSTPRYDGLLSLVPGVLVSTAAMLAPLVQLLCAEMQLAFEEHGLSLPPWRQAKSMLSKWLPQKSRDTEPSPYGSPRAASPDAGCYPLLGAATATAPSSVGCPTPGRAEDEAVSPRAVLSSASAMLITQASVAHAQPNFKAKSLLSDRLQLTMTASAALPLPVEPAASRAPRRCASERVTDSGTSSRQPPQVQVPLPQHQAGPPDLFRVSAGSGMVYRVEAEWQEPPIRKVKMQGGAVR